MEANVEDRQPTEGEEQVWWHLLTSCHLAGMGLSSCPESTSGVIHPQSSTTTRVYRLVSLARAGRDGVYSLICVLNVSIWHFRGCQCLSLTGQCYVPCIGLNRPRQDTRLYLHSGCRTKQKVLCLPLRMRDVSFCNPVHLGCSSPFL